MMKPHYAGAAVGKPLERVDAAFVHQKEPAAAAPQGSALWMPTLGSVRNPRLGQALRARLAAMPSVTLLERCDVQGFIQRHGQVVGVATSQGDQFAERLVVCGGAWAAQLLEGLNVRLPVRPVKGQMIAYQAPPGLVKRVVLKDVRYVIPRSDGLLLVGSTLEEAGFDKTTDAKALASLKRSAENMNPRVGRLPCRSSLGWAAPWLAGRHTVYWCAGRFSQCVRQCRPLP